MTDRNSRLGEHESPNSPKYWSNRDCTKQEMVNHPGHYNMGNPAYEPYKVISEWGCNFNIGNAIKYLARYKQKWNPIEDLEKAKKYIDFEIERLKGTEGQESVNERGFPINLCDSRNCENKIVNGNDLQETSPEEKIRNRELAERICRGEEIVDRANKALDEGMSRIDVMRNVLKMSDDEIAEVMKMNGIEDACKKIASKIVDDMENEKPRRGMYFHY
jgi:hypothetical protein